MPHFQSGTSLVGEVQSNEELPLAGLIGFAGRHRLGLLGGALMGGALGLAVAFVLPAQWEAVAQLRIAQIGVAPLGAMTQKREGSTTVEQPLRVVERVTQKSFKDDVLRRMGVSLDESDPKASMLRTSLKAKIEKSDLVGVRVRGASPDEAALFMNALITELASVHTKMMEPTLQRWHSEIEEIDIELKRMDRELARLRGSFERQSGVTQTATPFQAVLSNMLLYSREKEQRELRERKSELQQLSQDQTSPTTSLGRIEVSTLPVSPPKTLFVVTGLIIGLFIGSLLSVMISAGIRRRMLVKS